MIAADGETVPVATEEKDMEIGPGQADAGSEGNGAPVNEVGAVAVNEIWKTRRATDARKSDNLLVIELAFLEDFVEGGEDSEVAAARAPGGMIGGNCLFGEFFSRRFRCWRGSCCGGIAHVSYLTVETNVQRPPPNAPTDNSEDVPCCHLSLVTRCSA